MKQPACLLLILLFHLLAGRPVTAHEMGTSALILHEQSAGSGQFVFKRTVSADGKVPPIDFVLTPACELRQVTTDWEEGTEVVQRGNFHCSSPLARHQVQAQGFTRLSPEMILLATPLEGPRIHQVLTPGLSAIQLAHTENKLEASAYFWIGVEHIVFGLDHVLFVTGVFLLWKKRAQTVGQLMTQFSLFTLGHSLTLALLVLGWISVPTRAIEAWIALSVLWLAWELIRPESGSNSGGWQLVLIAAFGLLHGSGFALSMEERGFPADALFSSLLWFNLGIEAGQVWIVMLLASTFIMLEKTHRHAAVRISQQMLTLGMGGAALYWTLERIHSYV